MLFTILGAVLGTVFGVSAALSDQVSPGRYMLIGTAAITLGFFIGRGLDILRARR